FPSHPEPLSQTPFLPYVSPLPPPERATRLRPPSPPFPPSLPSPPPRDPPDPEPRWPKWIPPFNGLASPSTTASLCRSPLVGPAPEVARGRVQGSHKGFGTLRSGGSLAP
ncbi:hypothetical protein MC885_010881, partial [Smutsia gigantea]